MCKTRTSIIFNTFLCLPRQCRTKLIELFDFFIRVLFVTQNCLRWKLCWASFFLNTSCTIGSATKFGGHLGGFGADMLEAEMNKLKEKIEHCAYLQGVLRLIRSSYKPESKAELASHLNQCEEGRLAISGFQKRSLNFPNLSVLFNVLPNTSRF